LSWAKTFADKHED